MSTIRKIYLGPFVRHLVEHDRFTQEFANELRGKLYYNWGVSGPPQTTQGDITYLEVCFMPNGVRQGKPLRDFFLDRENASFCFMDDLDILDEIRWFTRSYQYELAEIATYLGREGMTHWGLVQWVS